mmetsp:Transcript_7508/g.19029  ORF Transcript_7508/g.19029 Transcript_7508/m.19029 type:complete len:407 (+) Transcript_7508:131-1351(+)
MILLPYRGERSALHIGRGSMAPALRYGQVERGRLRSQGRNQLGNGPMAFVRRRRGNLCLDQKVDHEDDVFDGWPPVWVLVPAAPDEAFDPGRAVGWNVWPLSADGHRHLHRKAVAKARKRHLPADALVHQDSERVDIRLGGHLPVALLGAHVERGARHLRLDVRQQRVVVSAAESEIDDLGAAAGLQQDVVRFQVSVHEFGVHKVDAHRHVLGDLQRLHHRERRHALAVDAVIEGAASHKLVDQAQCTGLLAHAKQADHAGALVAVQRHLHLVLESLTRRVQGGRVALQHLDGDCAAAPLALVYPGEAASCKRLHSRHEWRNLGVRHRQVRLPVPQAPTAVAGARARRHVPVQAVPESWVPVRAERVGAGVPVVQKLAPHSEPGDQQGAQHGGQRDPRDMQAAVRH